MKKCFYSIALILALGITTPASVSAATATTQTSKKKSGNKSGSKKSVTQKKYVPSSTGDCYVGEEWYWQEEPQNIELTLYPDGTCEWRANGKLEGKGTFTGTITGKKYVVKVNVPNVGNYTFEGTKEQWSFGAPRESVELNLKH